MDVIIPLTMKTQMHTAGPICESHCIARHLACIASAIYAMVMRKFGPVFCISVFFEKGIMTLTLYMTDFVAFCYTLCFEEGEYLFKM